MKLQKLAKLAAVAVMGLVTLAMGTTMVGEVAMATATSDSTTIRNYQHRKRRYLGNWFGGSGIYRGGRHQIYDFEW